uniref:Protein kinase domain-containing protein n=1 Tax=Macrostomum lignano TaxID=282301 RepID=A0A1I8F7G4_9PLAT
NVVHTFEGRQTKSGAAPEFRLVIDNPTIDARLAGGFRAEPMLVEFALSRDKPRHPFMDQEADISAHQLLNCIRQLLQPKTPAKTPTTPLPSGASSASAGGGSRGGPVADFHNRSPSPLGLSSVSSSDAAFESPGGNVGDSSGGAFDDDQPASLTMLKAARPARPPQRPVLRSHSSAALKRNLEAPDFAAVAEPPAELLNEFCGYATEEDTD